MTTSKSTYESLLQEMLELHKKKSADYGKVESGDPFRNLKQAAEFGVPPWVGTMIRANDKMMRIQAFARRGNLVNESVEDSLRDLAAYAVLALCLYLEENEEARWICAITKKVATREACTYGRGLGQGKCGDNTNCPYGD